MELFVSVILNLSINIKKIKNTHTLIKEGEKEESMRQFEGNS